MTIYADIEPVTKSAVIDGAIDTDKPRSEPEELVAYALYNAETEVNSIGLSCKLELERYSRFLAEVTLRELKILQSLTQ